MSPSVQSWRTDVIPLTSSGVEHYKFAAWMHCNFEIVSAIWALKICQEVRCRVVGRASFFRPVELVQGPKTWRAANSVPRRRTSTLLRAVLHNRHARRDAMHQRRTSTPIESVMRRNVDVRMSEFVHGANQFEFFCPRQIAQ